MEILDPRKRRDGGLSAEATIDRLLAEVAAFRGDTPQSDDMACVVARVLGEVAEDA